MISVAYVQTMARYNTWQNRNIYEAAKGLTDAQRKVLSSDRSTPR